MLMVRSPVRISFGGGGTDLPGYYEEFGGAVLSAAINKHFYTILKKRNDGRIQVISSDLRVTETWRDISRMDVKQSELAIPLAARKVLGKPVGKQDEYAAAFGGLNYISFHRDGSTHVKPIRLRPDILREFQSSLMLFFTGAAHNSWSLLQAQEKNTKKGAGATLDSLHEIRALADRMRDALEEGDFRSFGSMMHEGWQAKKRISSQISTSVIDQAYEAALASGALGGKSTGAGGGGFLLLFCKEEFQDNVRHALGELGIREMAFEIDFDGAHVAVSDPFIDGDEKCGMQWVFSPVEAQ